MEIRLKTKEEILNFDLRKAISANRLVGLWRLLTGYHWHYGAATVLQGLSAYAKTLTYFLLSYFVDNYLINKLRLSDPVDRVGFGPLLVQGHHPAASALCQLKAPLNVENFS